MVKAAQIDRVGGIWVPCSVLPKKAKDIILGFLFLWLYLGAKGDKLITQPLDFKGGC